MTEYDHCPPEFAAPRPQELRTYVAACRMKGGSKCFRLIVEAAGDCMLGSSQGDRALVLLGYYCARVV